MIVLGLRIYLACLFLQCKSLSYIFFKLVLIQFTGRNDVTTYLLRDSVSVNKLTVPSPCTNYYKIGKILQD